MDPHDEVTIFTDGAARGNPGPAAFAFIIERPGSPAIAEKGFLGNATNNVAEYTGLVRALERAQEIGARRVVVNSDSELMVKQMNGEYRVKNSGLLPLYEQASDLRRRFEKVAFRHVRRESNKDADRLCNEALDAEAGDGKGDRARAAKVKKPAARAEDLEARVRDDAIACLQAAAGAWKRGEQQPTADAVWEQLWSILVEAGVLRK
jgi:ribonuclease HI